ncbi:hypothetical protein [Rhodopila sp.]|uniref:hypothetical protein n=1 Tax=Rhodopila sp. TaxID=2480087 RepID=UPI003D12B461
MISAVALTVVGQKAVGLFKGGKQFGWSVLGLFVAIFVILVANEKFDRPLPELSGTVEQMFMPATQVDPISSEIILAVTIRNSGTMPSAIVSWTVTANFNGDKHQAVLEGLPSYWQFSDANLANYAYQKPLINEGFNAIPVGGLIKGNLSLKFPGVEQVAFFNYSPQIELKFKDVMNKEYVVDWTGSPARRVVYRPRAPMNPPTPQTSPPGAPTIGPVAPPSQPQATR